MSTGTRIGFLIATAALLLGFAIDVANYLVGGVALADVFYLPLRELPLEEHRDEIEQTIVDTAAGMHHRGALGGAALHGLALAGVALAWADVHRRGSTPAEPSGAA